MISLPNKYQQAVEGLVILDDIDNRLAYIDQQSKALYIYARPLTTISALHLCWAVNHQKHSTFMLGR